MFHFYWGGPLLFGPLQCISLGGPDPPDPQESTRLHIRTKSTRKYMLFNRTIFMLAGHIQELSHSGTQM